MGRRRYVVLDRDGTVIVERHYLSDPAHVELIPGVAQALRHLRQMGLGLVVLTNQSGVGRGLFDAQRVEEIHQRMRALLDAEGVQLDGVFYCPHTPDDGCQCRKPEPGLLEQAATHLGFDPRECVVIGDKVCDIELGKRVGATTMLVRTGYGTQMEEACGGLADHFVDDVASALPMIRQWLTRTTPPAVRLSAPAMDLVILCGGRGSRLGALSAQTPKPLLPVGGQPFLWHVLRWMKRQGFRRAILAAHHLAEQFQAFATTHGQTLPDLEVIVEPAPLGTGGALRHAADYVRSSTFVAINGDTWLPQPLTPVLRAHERAGRRLTAVVVEAIQVEGSAAGKGTWDVGPDGVVRGFATPAAAVSGWVNGGIYVLDRRLARSWPRGSYSLEADLMSLVTGSLVGVFRSTARLLDIGTPESLALAEQRFTQSSHALLQR